jgi:hypothetical protein
MISVYTILSRALLTSPTLQVKLGLGHPDDKGKGNLLAAFELRGSLDDSQPNGLPNETTPSLSLSRTAAKI